MSIKPLLFSRREFLLTSSAAALAATAGCATNPVTGRNEFMLFSDEDEIKMDKEASPHQFSSDYGAIQDSRINEYIREVGQRIAAVTHRPQMPYSFRGLNAVYVNAYTFPAGSIAVTRGMLVDMQDEVQLAAVLGHEIGHVNARHTSRAMSRGLVVSVLVSGVASYAGSRSKQYADVVSGIGGLGAGLWLAGYSRDNEREADALGMEYMTKAGANPHGMVELMELLKSLSNRKPNALETLFATHPMSEERYQTAVAKLKADYANATDRPLYRERYMDNTARLRAIKDALDAMQKSETLLAKGKFDEAAAPLSQALKQVPHDYAGLLLMARCQIGLKRFNEARQYALSAQGAYPGEAQAHYVTGMAEVKGERYDEALSEFKKYESMLPGNPLTGFYGGYCHENMGHRPQAAEAYKVFLKQVDQGEEAKHAYKRLVEWGYITPQATRK